MKIHGDRLTQERERRGLSREELAREACMTASTLAAFEAGGTADPYLCQCLHRVLNDPRFEQPYVPIEELATARPPVIPAGRQRTPRTPSACAPDTREIDLDSHGPVFEFVRHAQAPSSDPPPVLVYTIHDGDRAPRGLVDRLGKVPADGLRERFHEGRDWGANAVASALSEALGLGGYHRANIARCFVDYGRLPGVSDRNVGRLQTRSISGWLASHLTRWEDREVLLSSYEELGDSFADILTERLGLQPRGHDWSRPAEQPIARSGQVLLAIHTYDTQELDGEARPPVSLIYKPHSPHSLHLLAPAIFDPIIPQKLVEFTADRMLVHRLALELERQFLPGALNYPYHLPEGSLELRTQVWMYFQHLHQVFMRSHDEPPTGAEWQLLWETLTNANSRESLSRLQSAHTRHLTHLRDLDATTRERLTVTRGYYELLRDFLMDEDVRNETVNAYRLSALRPSNLVLEIRKDLLYDGEVTDGNWFRPDENGLRTEEVHRIASWVAQAVLDYLDVDRPYKLAAELTGDLPRWRNLRRSR